MWIPSLSQGFQLYLRQLCSHLILQGSPTRSSTLHWQTTRKHKLLFNEPMWQAGAACHFPHMCSVCSHVYKHAMSLMWRSNCLPSRYITISLLYSHLLLTLKEEIISPLMEHVQWRHGADQMAPCLKVLLLICALNAHQWSLGERWERLQSVTNRWTESCFPCGADWDFLKEGECGANVLTGWPRVKSAHQRKSRGFNVEQPSGCYSLCRFGLFFVLFGNIFWSIEIETCALVLST